MKVEDIVRVVGRGHIVCRHMDGRTIRVGDKVMAGDTEFEENLWYDYGKD